MGGSDTSQPAAKARSAPLGAFSRRVHPHSVCHSLCLLLFFDMAMGVRCSGQESQSQRGLRKEQTTDRQTGLLLAGSRPNGLHSASGQKSEPASTRAHNTARREIRKRTAALRSEQDTVAWVQNWYSSNQNIMVKFASELERRQFLLLGR
jgi:hypothetical protein